jgi:hypothetical protein
MRCATRTLLLMMIAAMLGGCISLSYGARPRVDRLDQLTPGQSRAADVLLALGEPRGKGAAHLAPSIPPRDVWYYELLKSSSDVMGINSTVNLSMLVVFMKGDVYDGYLWFSSLEHMGRKDLKPSK